MSAIIDQIVATIRAARYGRDVRESIARGIELIDDVAEGAQGSATESASEAFGYCTRAEQAANNAETDASHASGYADTASSKATLSESWAVGGTGTRPGEDTNNAEYWARQAAQAGDKSLDDLIDVTLSSPTNGQVLKYDSSQNKWVNGNESGGGGGTTDYTDLTNKPSINNVTLSGNKSLSDLGIMPSDGVEANPQGSASEDLSKLRVGNDVYGIPSGGHTIKNSSGTSMTQRDNLQFNNCTVTDDNANNKTIVTPNAPLIIPKTYEDYLVDKTALDASGNLIKIMNQGVANNAVGVGFNNANVDLLAGNVQAAIEELDGKITAITYGTAVNLAGATGYTAPADGTIQLTMYANSTGMVLVRLQGKSIFRYDDMSIFGGVAIVSTFVKKGMVIKDDSTGTPYQLQFFPLE